jgi:hypothetical protein
LGVFVRDIVQGIALVLMAWMYLTPIIYPESLVPAVRATVDMNADNRRIPAHAPDNPKTSMLASLSAIALLRQLSEPVRVGS